MSFWSSIPVLGNLAGKVADKIAVDKDKFLEAQTRQNELEISGAPASRMRLWRPFLGWVFSLGAAWELLFRPVIATYWPNALLPPSMIDYVMRGIAMYFGIII